MATLDATSTLEERLCTSSDPPYEDRLQCFARVTHMYDWMSNRKLVIIADLGTQTHDIAILIRFILLYLMMETHGLGSISIQCISSFKGTVLHYGM